MIKTKLIKTDKAEIFVIGSLPEDAIIGLIKHGGMVYRVPVLVGEPLRYIVDLPPGEWQPIGFLDKIPEDVAKELVEAKGVPQYSFELEYPEYIYDEIYYRDYLEDDEAISFTIDTATESLHSLVAANCKLENPLGEMKTKYDTTLRRLIPENIREARIFNRQWQAEEEKVFRNPYLLKKLD